MRSNELIIIILLIILVVFAFIYGIGTSSRSRYSHISISTKSVVLYEQDKPIIDEIIHSKRQSGKTEYVSWGRSPFFLSAQSTK